MEIELGRPVPILRILDVAKADEFYLGWLGFTVDWDHRFDDGAPLFRQVRRAGLVLNLSEHHGDGIPGHHLRVPMRGIDVLHAELIGKKYRYGRPGIETQPWGSRELTVHDPFGNQITFSEPLDAATPIL